MNLYLLRCPLCGKLLPDCQCEIAEAAAPLSAPRHLSEEANAKMINEIDEFQAKAEVASSPSPTRLWERVSEAAAKVESWPDWKKGSPVNRRDDTPEENR